MQVVLHFYTYHFKFPWLDLAFDFKIMIQLHFDLNI